MIKKKGIAWMTCDSLFLEQEELGKKIMHLWQKVHYHLGKWNLAKFHLREALSFFWDTPYCEMG